MQSPEQLFKALGEETRLRLLHLLVVSEETLCVCEMMDALELPQYQISRHLRILKHAGLITSRRRGTWMYYSLERGKPGNNSLFDFLRDYLETFYVYTPFVKDIERLQKRLALREEDSCVVGLTSERNLHV